MNKNHEIIIGLDLGTTNCKALALAENGNILGSASSEHSFELPHPGWAEQDAQTVWGSAASALRNLIPGLPKDQIAGIALSGAMHSLLLVDQQAAPLAPAMTWADQRSAPQAEALRNGLGRQEKFILTDVSATPPQDAAHSLYTRTGCPLVYLYFPAKLRWWQEQAPEMFQRASLFASLKDWVLCQLTGHWATDIGIGSTTGLLNIQSRNWDEDAMRLAGVTADRFPPLVSPFEVIGNITQSAAQATGLTEGLPVVAGMSDGGLADIGSGAYLPGMVTITVGTSGAVRKVVSDPHLDPYERTWCYLQSEDQWFAGGATNNGGIVVEWARQQFFGELGEADGYAQLFSAAGSAPPGAEGVMFLPYLNGERSPSWDACARGTLLGLSLRTSRSQIARAALEGVAFCLADIYEALDPHAEHIRLSGGITREPVWMQIVADVIGTRTGALEAGDASAVGAAILGHQALGTSSLPALASRIQPADWFAPDKERHAIYRDLHKKFQELAQAIEKNA